MPIWKKRIHSTPCHLCHPCLPRMHPIQTHQRQNEAGHAGGLQADLSRPCQTDRSSGGLSQSGDAGARGLRCPSIGRSGRQPVELRGARHAHPFGGLRRGDRGMAKAVIPSTRIHQGAHERCARTACSHRLNARHAMIIRNTRGSYRIVTTAMQDVSLFPQTALAPPPLSVGGEGRNHIRSHRPKP